MNQEFGRSYFYKELHPNYWNQLLENPKIGEFAGMVFAGGIVAGLILLAVIIGH